ncbi:MAG: PKD domain-containing protein, partial [Phycisphaerae bacterium]
MPRAFFIAIGMAVLVLAGCDAAVNSGTQGEPTLGALAVENVDAVGVASTNSSGGSNLSVRTSTPFCCEPNERILEARYQNEPIHPLADCQWKFSDGRTINGCEITHNFATSGFHSALLSVDLPSGESATYEFEITLTEVGSFADPASVFDTDMNGTGGQLDKGGSADSQGSNDANPSIVDSGSDDSDESNEQADPSQEADGESQDEPNAQPDNDADDVTVVEEQVDVELFDVDAGIDVVVYAGRPVQLDGDVNYESAAGEPTMTWQQRSGPPVAWADSHRGLSPVLRAPTTAQPIQIELAFVVSTNDPAGDVSIMEDTMMITVEPVPTSLNIGDPRWAEDLSDDYVSLQDAFDSGAATITIPDTRVRTVGETL